MVPPQQAVFTSVGTVFVSSVPSLQRLAADWQQMSGAVPLSPLSNGVWLLGQHRSRASTPGQLGSSSVSLTSLAGVQQVALVAPTQTV